MIVYIKIALALVVMTAGGVCIFAKGPAWELAQSWAWVRRRYRHVRGDRWERDTTLAGLALHGIGVLVLATVPLIGCILMIIFALPLVWWMMGTHR